MAGAAVLDAYYIPLQTITIHFAACILMRHEQSFVSLNGRLSRTAERLQREIAMLALQNAEVIPFQPAQTSYNQRKAKPLSFEDRIGQATVRRLAAKEHIFCEGDTRKFVYQLEEGVVLFYRMLPDGRRQVIDFAYPGDIIGLGAPGDYFFSAQATGPARVRCIPIAVLEEAAHNDPDLAIKLYKAVSVELSAARVLLTAIGQRSAMERIATFLLMLYRRNAANGGASNIIDLPMRRSDIADLLGLTIETVSRTITKLRMMSVVAAGQGSSLRILSLDRLQELAAGD